MRIRSACGIPDPSAARDTAQKVLFDRYLVKSIKYTSRFEDSFLYRSGLILIFDLWKGTTFV
ncbi:MAG: hypothetical protein NZ455_06635 [Bacteroidia bacterium]|nr:hypothetical protein [Bacteroidia bacterium]MDW8345712.1 hypothetical protein [Bacteroidia bacterium]